MKGDYLWDGSGEPDLEVVRLERALKSERFDEQKDLPDLSVQPPQRRRRPRWLVPAIALVPIAAAAALLLYWQTRAPEPEVATPSPPTQPRGPERPSLSVKQLAGSPLVDEAAIATGSLMRPGQWLVTDQDSRALIELGDIGEVRVGPHSRVRLVETGPAEQRLELRHGTLHAVVSAPPRLFLVDLPSATAVDLGCVYDLVVDRDGSGVLRVATGEVSLEGHGRASLVPAGSACETRPGHGPGTPYRADAPSRLIGALRRFDFEAGGGRALDAVLSAAGARDTLTLWHLIPRATGPDRQRVITRLAGLAPPPPGVRLDDPAGLDQPALDAWRGELEASW
ncbi:MAG TPA: FecR family protein [Kofleriaceae bacterium]|nr:FecR family protein [Kofleriaceae bacterium]